MLEIRSSAVVRSEDGGWPPNVVAPADRERFARYEEALAFYRGEQWLGRRRRNETRLTFNYARALVRKVASYVFPAPVTFSVPGPGDDPALRDAAGRAERLLTEIGAELDLARLDIELCVDAAVLGDGAVKVTWDAAAGRPTVAPVDPAGLLALTAPDNPRRLLAITQRYDLPGAEIDRLVEGMRHEARGMSNRVPTPKLMPLASSLMPDRVYPVAEAWTAERWRVSVAGQIVRDGTNPYGWIPYLVLANDPRPHAFWGESDLLDLFDVCRELNARMSVLARVLELSGAPIAVLENVDGSEGISVGPGAKWELPEGAKAYLLDLLGGGGVGLHVQFIDLLYRSLHDLSETPRTAFGDSGRDLSGAALEVEIQPLVQKVGRKRRAWEAFFRRRNALLLDLLERFGGHDLAGLRRADAIWPPVLPSDADAAVRNQTRLVAAGVHSRRTAVAALGHDDPDAELGRVIEELRLLGGVEGSRSRGVVIE